ncbi:MAG: class I SAM-dependent methyltransferase [Parvularculaceae bacterium]|nr:class I SAM-dependent methyltransferase [Parvularculaceae bacterium]
MLAEVALHLQADFSVILWDGSAVPMKPGAADDLTITITSPDVIRRLLLKPGLPTMVKLLAGKELLLEGGSPLDFANRWDHGRAVHLLKRIDRGLMARNALPFLLQRGTDPAQLPSYLKEAGETKEERDDQEMIAFHYDVSNEFFQLFLDDEMVYSNGYYLTGDETLEKAQCDKLDLICRKLRLQPGERLLEIGCGWGALACHAAKNYGVHVHGFTLSKEQLAFAQTKVDRMGLNDQITLELKDYRTLEGESELYDKIAQVEMFEHVGWENFDTHFELVRKLLKPRGLYFHQATTRRGGKDLTNFRKATGAMNFITTHIFPGGELDYVGNSVTNMGRLGLEVLDVECLREHYILTITEWERRLTARRDEAIAEAGYARTLFWQMYFALFAKAFERTSCSNYAIVAAKRAPGLTGVPMDRSTLYPR